MSQNDRYVLFLPIGIENKTGILIGWANSATKQGVHDSVPSCAIVAGILPCGKNDVSILRSKADRRVQAWNSGLCSCWNRLGRPRGATSASPDMSPLTVQLAVLGSAGLGTPDQWIWESIRLLDVSSPPVQVVFYTPGTVYRHKHAAGGFFGASLLPRLSQAARVMEFMSGTSDVMDSKPHEQEAPSIWLPDVPWMNESFLWRHVRQELSRRPAVGRKHGLSSSCPHCNKDRFSLGWEERIDYMNRTCRVWVNRLLGWSLVAAFSRVDFSGWTAYATHFEWMRQGLLWLERFPVGFKLNEPLTKAMGSELRVRLEGYELSLRSIPIDAVFRAVFIVVGILFGASGLCCLLLDAWRVSMLHLSLLAQFFALLYRAELYLLAALWRLFRGKKRNYLRQRTDTMEYDAMQLLLGTILFSIVLFLFTTVLVYHVHFATIQLGIACASTVLAGTYVWIERFPSGAVLLRFRRPDVFVERVRMTILPSNGKPDSFPITRLDSDCESYESLVAAALSNDLKSLSRTVLRSIVALMAPPTSPGPSMAELVFEKD